MRGMRVCLSVLSVLLTLARLASKEAKRGNLVLLSALAPLGVYMLHVPYARMYVLLMSTKTASRIVRIVEQRGAVVTRLL